MRAIEDGGWITYRQILLRRGEVWHELRQYPGRELEYVGAVPIFVMNEDPENPVVWQVCERTA